MVCSLDRCDTNHQPWVCVLHVHLNIQQLPYPGVYKKHVLWVWGSKAGARAAPFLHEGASVILHGDT